MSDRTPDLTPDWLSAHIDELLDRGPGFVGMSGVTYVELDSTEDPMSLIAAVLADWDSSGDVDVRFVPWRGVRAVGVHGYDLDIYLSDQDQSTSFPVYTDNDEDPDSARAERARELALKITAMMRRSLR